MQQGVGSYVPPAYSYPINCSNPYVDYLAYNTSLYAPPEFNVTYQGKNYTVPCGQMVLSAVPYQIDCGPNLVLNEEQQVCGFSCPLPSLSDSQYENVKIMQGILGWLSWVWEPFHETYSISVPFHALVFNCRSYPVSCCLS